MPHSETLIGQVIAGSTYVSASEQQQQLLITGNVQNQIRVYCTGLMPTKEISIVLNWFSNVCNTIMRSYEFAVFVRADD